LGRASAEALAAEGCKVALCARGEEALAATAKDLSERHDAEVFYQTCDVDDPDSRADFLAAVEERFGPIDVLVVNGGGPVPGTALSVDQDQLDEAVQGTLLSKIHWARAVAGGMAERGWGRILFIESTSVKQPIAGLALSNTMRAGVAGFAKTLASELASKGVLVNLVLPGSMDTDRLSHLFEARAKTSGASIAVEREKAETQIPVGRIGKPEEFGSVVAFLASEKASYVTGAVVPVDGGNCRGLL